MPEQITQLGISGLTLFILFFIVRYFVKALESKDKRINEMADQFRLVMENHIQHEQTQWEKTATILDQLLIAVKEMNGNNRKNRKK